LKFFKLINLLFLLSLSFIYAQDSNESVIDSLFKELNKVKIPLEQSKYGKCIKITSSVLQKAKEINSVRIQGHCYNILGYSYYNNNDSLSFDNLFKAVDAFKQIGDTLTLTSVYSNISANYIEQGDNVQAEKFIRKALEITKNNKKLIRHRAYPLFNLADLSVIKGNYKEGIKLTLQVLEICKQNEHLNKRHLIGDSYELLSYAHYKLGNKDQSELYYKKTEAYGEKYKYFNVLTFLYYRRQALFKEDGNFTKAYELLHKYTSVSDSIDKLEEFEIVKQVETDYVLTENKKQLALAKKEQEFQKAIINRGLYFTLLLALITFCLLICLYLIYVKNKKYKIAKDDAEQLSKVKSNFYSEISHELRTPLYAVIELSRLLLKENINRKHKEYLESLNFSGNHLLSLINNVLELNKVESGKLELQILNFKLKDLINNVAESLEYALRDNHNTIHMDYDVTIPEYLNGDSLKLSQLFINLISNAIKFTNNGNIYVTTKLIDKTDKDVKIYFEIKDDGIGISKEKQSKIFEEFYQEHNENKNTYNGTGLGLPIVKRILKTMGSEILIDSEVNEGCKFSFEIDFSYHTNTKLNIVAPDVLSKDLEGMNFLIVDDNKINQLVTKKVLDQINIKSKSVNSGEEALVLFKTECFDCILMDLHMPGGIDGYETSRRIRLVDLKVPIIALTAASTEEIENKIYDCKMNAYVSKPFIASDFIETMHRCITR